ncbi:DUF4625 domain-containing protein [Belliella sp. DSM 111904]|uniref:DUF4625 domain-containing protein n=1 Tax=Belliella filtrata TaxID=2923435 RepID=A0ABS9UZJ4_9BACT|nr:DUF4625 domain-containing protein [Belliella filtrata]MCH7409498.1 DUF4625 domain-containing protein [Belliella filtrata]
MEKSDYSIKDLICNNHLTKVVFVLLLTFSFACNEDADIDPVVSIFIENVEIGSGNNGIGIIGRDFHFDMDVEAHHRIDIIEVSIEQRTEETYTEDWSFKITWEEFKGARNTNVHKHFNIPNDAPEGVFDFVIRVSDESGGVHKEIHSIELNSAASLPVDPQVYSLMVNKVDQGFFYIMNRGFVDSELITFSKDEIMNTYIDIRNVKDNGTLYVLIIKKSEQHLPESIDNIDFSKVIVADVLEHVGLEEVTTVNNYIGVPGNAPQKLTIGSTMDNHSPEPNPIEDNKAWENGAYYYGVVYTNTTHNMSAFYYFSFNISGF